MPRAPALIGAGVIVASTAWSVRVVVAETRLSTGSAALLGLDVVVLASVVVAGMLLARARWARPSAALLLAAELAFLPALPQDGWNLAVLVLCGMALAGVGGPWLNRWLRRLPNAEGPPGSVVVLLLGLLALPGVAAIANPTGAVWGSWLLSVVAVGSAWAYGRAHAPALWVIRLGLAPAAVPALLQSTVVGSATLALAITVLLVLAWRGEAGLVVRPLVPQRGETYPIPPELVPPELLRDAGYDERGRPLHRP